MAKKETRGLPSDFDLDLPSDKPVELGDYLDEEAPSKGRTVHNHASFTTPAPQIEARPAGIIPATPLAPLERGYLSRQQLRGAVPRKQLNASPETMRMLDELLLQVRQQSMEKDVRTSELFHAMVLSIYEARTYLDLSAVPRRGQWGSPTAASLPVALKNAFMDAISRTRPRR